MSVVEEILNLFSQRGGSQYGGECVTQAEHALQCATLAENEQAAPELVAAALLHDIGHLLHDLPADAPDRGVDDFHENSAAAFLRKHFPDCVAEPVRLHVAAKRYLCARDATYHSQLSPPSVVSLNLQGGPMTSREAERFEANPFAEDAVRLRKWDDTAKDPDFKTPPLSHFEKYLRMVVTKGGDA